MYSTLYQLINIGIILLYILPNGFSRHQFPTYSNIDQINTYIDYYHKIMKINSPIMIKKIINKIFY